MHKNVLWILAVLISGCASANAGEVHSPVVSIRWGYSSGETEEGMCTGSVFKNGPQLYFLTAAHCFNSELTYVKLLYGLNGDQSTWPWEKPYLGTAKIPVDSFSLDFSRDLAIAPITSVPAGYEVLEIGSRPLKAGQKVTLIGYGSESSPQALPCNIGTVGVGALGGTLIPTQLRLAVNCAFPVPKNVAEVQNTDLMYGYSGGPLLDEQGQLVGVMSKLTNPANEPSTTQNWNVLAPVAQHAPARVGKQILMHPAFAPAVLIAEEANRPDMRSGNPEARQLCLNESGDVVAIRRSESIALYHTDFGQSGGLNGLVQQAQDGALIPDEFSSAEDKSHWDAVLSFWNTHCASSPVIDLTR